MRSTLTLHRDHQSAPAHAPEPPRAVTPHHAAGNADHQSTASCSCGGWTGGARSIWLSGEENLQILLCLYNVDFCRFTTRTCSTMKASHLHTIDNASLRTSPSTTCLAIAQDVPLRAQLACSSRNRSAASSPVPAADQVRAASDAVGGMPGASPRRARTRRFRSWWLLGRASRPAQPVRLRPSARDRSLPGVLPG